MRANRARRGGAAHSALSSATRMAQHGARGALKWCKRSLRWDYYRLSGPVRREMRHAMAPAIGLTGRDADTVDVHLAVGDGVGTVRAREREAVGRDAGRLALDAADVELYRAGEGVAREDVRREVEAGDDGFVGVAASDVRGVCSGKIKLARMGLCAKPRSTWVPARRGRPAIDTGQEGTFLLCIEGDISTLR